MKIFEKAGFVPADILLPKEGFETWSVVACDQFTSEPGYWEETEKTVGESPSALRLIYPEIYLEAPDRKARIEGINRRMAEYITQDIFQLYENSFVLIERTYPTGKSRLGLIGAIDLEAYDFRAGSKSMVRATEGTILERIPPRVQIREHAILELPHIILLIADPEKTVIEPLAALAKTKAPIYDFDLMQNGGHLRGAVLSADEALAAGEALIKLGAGEKVRGESPLVYAVGDGNHSLATAKTCWENIKKDLKSEEELLNHPARYALVELGNLYDDGLEFEPIHRVLFDCEPQKVKEAFGTYFKNEQGENGTQTFEVLWAGARETWTIEHAPCTLTVGSLQRFLDDYVKTNGGRLDYIHGEDVTEKLSNEPNTMGFLLPVMDKHELYPTVEQEGALPRKTFSMGEANEKRYYLEARRIR